MNKILKVIITLIISFVFSYLIVGYVVNNFGVAIHWTPDATVWDKLREYYIRTAQFYIFPTITITIIATVVISIKITFKR